MEKTVRTCVRYETRIFGYSLVTTLYKKCTTIFACILLFITFVVSYIFLKDAASSDEEESEIEELRCGRVQRVGDGQKEVENSCSSPSISVKEKASLLDTQEQNEYGLRHRYPHELSDDYYNVVDQRASDPPSSVRQSNPQHQIQQPPRPVSSQQDWSYDTTTTTREMSLLIEKQEQQHGSPQETVGQRNTRRIQIPVVDMRKRKDDQSLLSSVSSQLEPAHAVVDFSTSWVHRSGQDFNQSPPIDEDESLDAWRKSQGFYQTTRSHDMYHPKMHSPIPEEEADDNDDDGDGDGDDSEKQTLFTDVPQLSPSEGSGNASATGYTTGREATIHVQGMSSDASSSSPEESRRITSKEKPVERRKMDNFGKYSLRASRTMDAIEESQLGYRKERRCSSPIGLVDRDLYNATLSGARSSVSASSSVSLITGTTHGSSESLDDLIVESDQRKKNGKLLRGVRSLYFATIEDRFNSVDEVAQAIQEAGLIHSRIILGIDYTMSNMETGRQTFNGKCLHHIDRWNSNPYQEVIRILCNTLGRFDEDNMICAFGFGDSRTNDRDVFKLNPASLYCHGFEGVLNAYNIVTPDIRLGGPTSFAPIIEESTRIVQDSGVYTILVIIADGQLVDDKPTAEAIVKASNYPLSIVMVGLGDGPWDKMREFDDALPQRTFDNFQFVNFHETVRLSRMSPGQDFDSMFALMALMEIPDQYDRIKDLGMIDTMTGKYVLNRAP